MHSVNAASCQLPAVLLFCHAYSGTLTYQLNAFSLGGAFELTQILLEPDELFLVGSVHALTALDG